MPNESGEWIMRGLDWDDPLRIRTPEELINYIDQVGFLPLFANELPGWRSGTGSVGVAGDYSPERTGGLRKIL